MAVSSSSRRGRRRALSAGSFYPLGATYYPADDRGPLADGVNFAVYSRHAREMRLCLFDEPDGEPKEVIRFEHRTRHVWHMFVPDLKPDQLYAFQADGEFDPGQGLRFNPAKLLIDPYARALSHKAENRDNLLLAYDPLSPDKDLSLDRRDNSRLIPKSIVIDDHFEWQKDRQLYLPLEQLVIYEVHLKGFTAHASSGVKHPGTYLGFIEKIPYLKELGVNAVEFLPLHEFVVEDSLKQRGLTNYWGYNTIAYFAPESSYGTGSSPGCQVREFKTLVRELHKAGIEVILDVVYNHTAEGSELGPTLSLRGLDNPSYYFLTGAGDTPRRHYMNFTGCGNSLNLNSQAALRLVMDSLRYWVKRMHVDGFRFDLASVLGREPGGFNHASSFFDAVAQDPVLSRVKLIAEPWDIGTYQVGNFPVDWSEWNGRYRDTVRRFVRGASRQAQDMGWRLTGSQDLYGDDGRQPYNSVNFITCHDGFTLRDLVSYDAKHNEQNGEENRDGTNDNNSWNCGAEGDSDDPAVKALRQRQARNLLCHLFLSSGTPLLLGGDEFFRTQKGNNNAYCQDNDLNWFDWSEVERHADLVRFTRRLIALMRACPALQSRKYFSRPREGCDDPLLTWYGPELQPPAWTDPELRSLCFRLDERPAGAGPGSLFCLFHASREPGRVQLPSAGKGCAWHRIIDTSLPAGEEILEYAEAVRLKPQTAYDVNARTTVVLVAKEK